MQLVDEKCSHFNFNANWDLHSNVVATRHRMPLTWTGCPEARTKWNRTWPNNWCPDWNKAALVRKPRQPRRNRSRPLSDRTVTTELPVFRATEAVGLQHKKHDFVHCAGISTPLKDSGWQHSRRTRARSLCSSLVTWPAVTRHGWRHVMQR